MTYWDIYVLVIIVIYLAAFFIRNLKTYFSIKTSIRGKSAKLSLSLLLSTIIYMITLSHILFPAFHIPVGKLHFLDSTMLSYIGYAVILIAIFIGLAALFEMRNSWRIGIKHDQKTDLVTTGIYAISRNPYFLSYDLLFFGIFLIYPSFLLLILIAALGIVFHFMIKEEEKYLDEVQGEPYLIYRKNVGRYFLFM